MILVRWFRSSFPESRREVTMRAGIRVVISPMLTRAGIRLAVSALLWFGVAVPAHAAPINPGFESGGFDGWLTSGSVRIEGSDRGRIAPFGRFQALVPTGPAAT